MPKGFTIGVASDTRDFSRGIKSGVIEPLDGVADVLEDMAKAGDKAGDDLERSMRDQQRSTEDLRGDYQKLNREIEDGSSRSSRAVSENTTHAARESSEGLDEIGESGRSNAIEVAASFDGSASSIADGFQGLAAEMFAGFGPAGVLAGVAVASGMGLISSALEKDKERAAELKQAASDLAGEFIETGKVGEVSVNYIADAMRALATETEDGKDNLTSLRREAKAAGVDVKDYQLANAGSAKATKSALKEAREELGRLSKQIAENGGTYTKAENKRQGELGKTIGKLLEVQKTQKDAATAAKDYYSSGADDLATAGEASQAYADSVQGALTSAGSDVEKYVKDGKFNLTAYQKAMEENARAVLDYQKNMATAQGDLAKAGHDKAIQYLENLGPDAAPLIAAFIKAPEKQKDQLAATWDTLGAAASSSFNTKLQSDFDANVATQKVKLVADNSELAAHLRALERNPPRLPVSLIPTTVGSGVRVK
ncbi:MULTISPECIES: hypothetical protein [unclassified Frondihabitans]|uniref:hypothetical protein n=1 Tax=unclassified Frondihabitans TaxID=2626248 RepID=UPI000F4D47BA|nr:MULTISPECIES: hypothetical protein [unclassified Frondihabitans]RPE75197.1 hypothetical protein EDF37_2801 [Frondihabitans sp. PhB153]RPF04439.1 hypothetical protein EDF39_2869 [Frondihabitans sp. PhB161]